MIVSQFLIGDENLYFFAVCIWVVHSLNFWFWYFEFYL